MFGVNQHLKFVFEKHMGVIEVSFFNRNYGELNILIFFEFAYGCGFNIYCKVHARLDDTYHHLVFSSHPDQLALQAGEGAVDNLHRVALCVDVGAHSHVNITAAQNAEVGDLYLRDDNRFALQHYELDNTVGFAHCEKVFGQHFYKDI